MGFSSHPTPPHDQFPQPTRPRFAADPEPHDEDDELVRNRHDVRHSTIHHHPHVTVDLSKNRAENRVESTSVLSPSTGATPKGEREAVDELLVILVECLEGLSTRSRETMLMRFFSEVERDERLEKFIFERMKQSKVKALTDLYDRIPPEIKAAAVVEEGDEEMMRPMNRSVVQSAEELTEKLERFKIKTLDFDQAEEEEEQKEQEEDKKKPQDNKPTK